MERAAEVLLEVGGRRQSDLDLDLLSRAVAPAPPTSLGPFPNHQHG